MTIANMLAGLGQGYVDAQRAERERLEKEELKKLQIKMFKHDLESKERQAAAKKTIIDAVSQIGPELLGINPEELGGDRPMRMGPEPAAPQGPSGGPLAAFLKTPQGQATALDAGYSLKDLKDFNRPEIPEIMARLQTEGAIGGATGSGGMELSGIKFDTSGQPMLDFSRRKAKGDWQPTPNGMEMVQYDEGGRVIARRPAAPGERSQTGGQKAVDTEFAKDYVSFKASGGYSDIEKNVNQLNDAVTSLEKGGMTGPVRGSFPDQVRKFTNPEALDTRDKVTDVVQRNLRLILGAQFTEKEGERLIARAYNETLDDATNAKRVRSLLTQIKTAAKAKQEAVNYFEKNGTLEGFTGKVWSMADFDPSNPKGTTTPPAGPAAGTVVNGYRFKGGDPNDKKNWERQ